MNLFESILAIKKITDGTFSEILSLEESIKKQKADINRKQREINNTKYELIEIVNNYSVLESKTLIESLDAQNPNNKIKSDNTIFFAQLTKLRYSVPSLFSNTMFSQLYSDLIKMEKELTELIKEKNDSISKFNTLVKSPEMLLIYGNKVNVNDFIVDYNDDID